MHTSCGEPLASSGWSLLAAPTFRYCALMEIGTLLDLQSFGHILTFGLFFNRSLRRPRAILNLSCTFTEHRALGAAYRPTAVLRR